MISVERHESIAKPALFTIQFSDIVRGTVHMGRTPSEPTTELGHDTNTGVRRPGASPAGYFWHASRLPSRSHPTTRTIVLSLFPRTYRYMTWTFRCGGWCNIGSRSIFRGWARARIIHLLDFMLAAYDASLFARQ